MEKSTYVPESAYQESLERVRSMPQSTEQEKGEKQEAAKLLRMEQLFTNAKALKLSNEKLLEKPDSTAEEVGNHILENAGAVNIKKFEPYIEGLKQIQGTLAETISDLETESLERGVPFEEVVFELGLAPHNRNDNLKPKGKITVEPPHPLALVMHAETDEDYFLMRGKVLSSGGFQGSRSHKNTLVPIIVIRNSVPNSPDQTSEDIRRADKVSRHEKGHAFNQTIKGYSKDEEKKFIWGDRPAENPIVIGKTLARAWLKSKKESSEFSYDSSEWVNALNYMNSCAKDELLADLNATTYRLDIQARNLTREDGIYNYVNSRLGLKTDTDLYKALWEDYTEKLQEQVKPAQEVLDVYKKFGLEERAVLMKGVLAQIPLEDWSTRLEDTLFLEEARELNEIYVAIKVLQEALKIPATKEDHINMEAKRVMFKMFQNMLKDKQDLPLLPMLREFKKALTYDFDSQEKPSITSSEQISQAA